MVFAASRFIQLSCLAIRHSGGPGPSGRNSAVSADNKQTMESFLSEFAYVNAILKARAWSVLHLWVLQGFVEPFVPCLSLRKHLQTQLQYIVRWLLCFFITQKVTLHCAFSFLATALSLAVLPITKTSTLWLLEVCCVGSTHSHIAACLRAFRGAVCLRGVHICAPKPLRQRPWPQDLGGFHKDPRDAVYSFLELRIRRQRSGDGVRAKGKALEGAGQCWICGHQKMNDIIHDIHSLQIARKHVHLVLILFPIHLRPLLPPNFITSLIGNMLDPSHNVSCPTILANTGPMQQSCSHNNAIYKLLIIGWTHVTRKNTMFRAHHFPQSLLS